MFLVSYVIGSSTFFWMVNDMMMNCDISHIFLSFVPNVAHVTTQMQQYKRHVDHSALLISPSLPLSCPRLASAYLGRMYCVLALDQLGSYRDSATTAILRRITRSLIIGITVVIASEETSHHIAHSAQQITYQHRIPRMYASSCMLMSNAIATCSMCV